MLNPNNQSVLLDVKRLIDKLLLEQISLRGIARVTGVNFSWLQNYVNTKFRRVPRQVEVLEKPKGKLIIECDEMWSFVSSKANKLYIWLAIDRVTREIIGCLSAIEPVALLVNFGQVYLLFIVNALSLIPTFGRLILKLFLANVINLLAKEQGKPTILKD